MGEDLSALSLKKGGMSWKCQLFMCIKVSTASLLRQT
jgi:hypothetical protein